MNKPTKTTVIKLKNGKVLIVKNVVKHNVKKFLKSTKQKFRVHTFYLKKPLLNCSQKTTELKEEPTLIEIDDKAATVTENVPEKFSCQLCNELFSDQLKFFLHLKSHYEPGRSENMVGTNADKGLISEKTDHPTCISVIPNVHCIQCNKSFKCPRAYDSHIREVHIKMELNEFSDHEDILDGIEVDEFDDNCWIDGT